VPTDSVSISNNNLTGKTINPVLTRVYAYPWLYKFNDDWNALVSQSYQNMNAQGVFYQMPYASQGLHSDPPAIRSAACRCRPGR